MNWLGTGAPTMLSAPSRFDAKPKRSAAIAALTGSHLPKITAARAMYPAPAVMPLPKAETDTTV